MWVLKLWPYINWSALRVTRGRLLFLVVVQSHHRISWFQGGLDSAS